MSVAQQAQKPGLPWLFSPGVDLLAFLGSALVSLLALWWGHQHGLLEAGDTPEWAWVSLILLVDVAHVYATGFRVYFDRQELSRRPLLYVGTPVISFIAAVVVYSESPLGFWRLLAYLAVFHFVRQQYGWVRLYRAQPQDGEGWSERIDTWAIYMATIYPLIYWHTALPRRFSWFVSKDFLTLPIWTERVAWLVYLLSLTAYTIKAVRLCLAGRPNPGKDIVMATTAVCWYVGIVAFNSDFAFTVTNVVIHGVPYIVLIWWYMIRREGTTSSKPSSAAAIRWKAAVLLGSTIWLLAYIEELAWNRTVWHEHDWLFGAPIDAAEWQLWIVPLLAVPQLTHYILDGFIWRRGRNPELQGMVSSPPSSETPTTGNA